MFKLDNDNVDSLKFKTVISVLSVQMFDLKIRFKCSI